MEVSSRWTTPKKQSVGIERELSTNSRLLLHTQMPKELKYILDNGSITYTEEEQKSNGVSLVILKYSTEFPLKKTYVIPEGRAATWGRGRPREHYPFEIEEYDDSVDITGDLHLNCEGMLINGCDWSYETQATKQDIRIIHIPT